MRADGWACHVALPGVGPLDDGFRAAGATLHVVPMRRISTSHSAAAWAAYALAWPWAVVRLTRLARRVGADVVHTNSLHGWYGWAAAALARLPHVWHAREIVVQSGAALRVERFLTRHFADDVVAMSEAIAAQFEPTHVTVIRDDPDPDEFSPARAGRFRAGAGIADDVPLVGAACRIDTWKGIDVLLDAVPALMARRPDAQVAVAGGAVNGKEDYERRLRARAGSLPGVHWLGERSDIAELLADLDVVVQASTEPEPYGLVLVEALCAAPRWSPPPPGGPSRSCAVAPDMPPVGRAGRGTPPPWRPPW